MIAIGFISSFGISVLLGGPLIRMLKGRGAKQTISGDAPSHHAGKQGTVTMGGLLILIGLLLPILIDCDLHPQHWTAQALLCLALAFGLIGFLDDYLIAARGKNLGLKARYKFALQMVVALV